MKHLIPSYVKILLICVSCVLLSLSLHNCASAVKEFPPDAFVVTGKMNPVSGSKAMKNDECWVLEAGEDLRSLKYYQVVGPKEMVEQLHEEDMYVKIRVVSRPTVKTNCPVGAVVEVLEIIEARSKKN